MTNQEKFSNAVFKFLTQVEVLDKDNAEDLYVTEDGKQTELGFCIPVYDSDVNLVVCPDINTKDIFLSLSDGPIDDIAFILEGLIEQAKTERHHWHAVTKAEINELNADGIYGFFYNKLRFVDLFESIDDQFEYGGKTYNVKAVMYLSKKETECYFEDEDNFYEMVKSKDPLKFSQLN